MLVALLLLVVIILFIILSKVSGRHTDIEEVKKDLREINTQLTELTKKISQQQAPPAQIKMKEEPAPKIILSTQEPFVKQQPVPVIKEEPTPEFTQQAETRSQPIRQAENISLALKKDENKIEEIYKEPELTKESRLDSWLRNNPDIEKFIGENLINKIGIGILVLGIAFFVKYAIDQNWINEAGRVGIGLLCGIILIGVAHRLRKNYRSFSSVLAGGGLTVFYFTIGFAFHQYQLISQTSSFIIMVIITAFAVILSILYNRIELAILATIGGFITPFLVSTGNGNYIVLFTYLCILNTGLIVLAFYKRWHILNFIAFVFTVFIYGGWIFSKQGTAAFSYHGTFIFGSVFYCMFLAMCLTYAAKKSVKLNLPDFSLLLVVNLAYYTAGIFLLERGEMGQFKGLFTASLGLINLILSYLFFKKNYIDRNFIFFLIGLTLTFISLAAPVQLEGNHITLFWSAEMVLLFWLYQRSFIKLLKIASALITILVLGSLLMDWAKVYGTTGELVPVILNKAFITTLFAASCMGLTFFLFKKEADTFYGAGITNERVRTFYIVISIVLFFLSGALEIYYQFSHRYAGAGVEILYLQLYITSFTILFFLALPKMNIGLPPYIRLGLPFILFWLFLLNTPATYTTEKLLLNNHTLQNHFVAHWVGIILFLSIIWITIRYIIANKENFSKILTASCWVSVICIVIILSVEIRTFYIWLTYKNADAISYYETLYSKAGLSIVWGISSFILIWLGMHYRFRPLRIIALSLFGITLIKLFAYDITNISPAGKIAAFILLGVLLLIVSFMYQRLKKLIIDDTNKKN